MMDTPLDPKEPSDEGRELLRWTLLLLMAMGVLVVLAWASAPSMGQIPPF